MTKVHPNAPVVQSRITATESPAPEALTVWRRSLLLNGNGFTVFDAKGNLVFRVDNYASGNKGEIVLMDAAGKSLLTVRRKKLSLAEQWHIYDGDEAGQPKFSLKKHGGLIQQRTLAHVTPSGGAGGLDVEGSYSQRRCMVYSDSRQPVAEIRRKEAVAGAGFGADVFRLVIYPGLDAAVAMAVVIVLEQMFGSRGS